MQLVICGFGSAGYSAMMTLKRLNPKAQITIVDPKKSDLVHPCGLPYALEGIVEKESLAHNIDLVRMGVLKKTGKCSDISPLSKTLKINTDTGVEEIKYDKLLISTGYKALMPPVENLEKHIDKSLFTLAGNGDLEKISSRLKNSSKAVVIGAGAIGLETAFALKKHLDEVTIIEKQNQILFNTLDPDMSAIVETFLVANGIKLIKGSSADRFNGEEKLLSVTCDSSEIEADLGVLASGFVPNIAAIKNSGIKTESQGIVVNRFLETSEKDIYAAGDCISGWWVIDGSPSKGKLATSAYKQGTVAAMNMMGKETDYKGSAGTFVTRIGNIEIAGTGFTFETAVQKGYKPVAGKITSHILPEYFPNNSQITIKIIFDGNTGKILGGQAIGEKGAAERINIISTAIEFNISIEELGRTELAYCPAVSEVYDPLLRAIDFGLRRMKK
ncbi:MAG: FAD-dependent oxidoreductase [Spirochaetota bacterium]